MRTGGRSERVVAAVLGAAVAELAEVGYGAFRLEDVAARAGVAKTTVYRRWPAKIDLVEAALRSVVRLRDEDIPDTGTARGDVLALLDRSVRLMGTSSGRAVARVMTTEGGDEDFQRLAKRIRDESRAYRARVIERAVARGELPASTDAYLVLDCIFAPVMSRILKFGESVDKKTRERLVDLVLTGAEHGGGRMKR
ncbi:MAG: TetR/AcrR family transcriptional regulator [Labilithrix sp.]|nr:TetR/AcrR family transcriptional regulator [Labilithrix sp.]MCW5816170.1 TetR/AcrR family transcriptional regulator [Labilithrix sp.]